MNRRGFLGAVVALAALPLVGKAKAVKQYPDVFVPYAQVLTDKQNPPTNTTYTTSNVTAHTQWVWVEG